MMEATTLQVSPSLSGTYSKSKDNEFPLYKKAVELSTAFLYSIDFQLIADLKSINIPPR